MARTALIAMLAVSLDENSAKRNQDFQTWYEAKTKALANSLQVAESLLASLAMIEKELSNTTRLSINDGMRCLPAVRRSCTDAGMCHMTDVYIALNENDFQANRLDQFQMYTIPCATVSHFHASNDGEDLQLSFPHYLYFDGIGRRDRSGYYRPLTWFNDNNPYVRDAFNHTIFVAATDLHPAAGHTYEIQGDYVIVNTRGEIDPKATREISTIINFDAGQHSGHTGETNTLMHEIAHEINNTLDSDDPNQQQFIRDVTELLGIIKPCLETSACIDLSDFRTAEGLVEAFLDSHEPMPPLLDHDLIAREFDPQASADARAIFQDPPMTMIWRFQSDGEDIRGEMGNAPLPEVRATYLPPNANFYRHRAMIFLLRFAEQIQNSYRHRLSDNRTNETAVNTDAEYEIILNNEPYSYLLGDGHIPPTLEYAYENVLSPAGLAWGRGEICRQQEAIDRANPYLNTPEGKAELRQLFRDFWSFVDQVSP